MKVHSDVEQGTAEWYELRRGRAGGSSFGKIATPRTGKLSAGHKAVIAQCLAEQVEFDSQALASSYWMERGIRMEPEARDWYEFDAGLEVEQVGYIEGDEPFGISPDGLIGDTGMIEIKCPAPKTHVLYLMEGTIPDAYRPQVYGSLYVSERDWCDFISYCPGFEPIIIRATINDDYFEQVTDTLGAFSDAYHDAKKRLFRDQN